jgi:hypothetical protein
VKSSLILWQIPHMIVQIITYLTDRLTKQLTLLYYLLLVSVSPSAWPANPNLTELCLYVHMCPLPSAGLD